VAHLSTATDPMPARNGTARLARDQG